MEHRMKLHENTTLFRQAIIATAESMQIPEIYIEKDYWVSYALQRIFADRIGTETIFKGGTALSKCFGLIERFSVDIDLVVVRQDSDSGNQLKAKIKRIGAVVSEHLPEVEVPGLSRRMGMNRKTAHAYPREFTGNYGQVRGNVIVVEATWLGSFEPSTTRQVSTYLADMILSQGQQALIAEYELNSFTVNALRPEQTLCEKIMSLVRFSYSEHPLQDLKLKIRHTYDLHKLLSDPAIQAFFQSEAFEPLFLTAANSDSVSYKNNHPWLAHHPAEALIFSDLENVWPELCPTYRSDFSNLVFGQLPDETAIFETLTAIKKRLSSIAWTTSIAK